MIQLKSKLFASLLFGLVSSMALATSHTSTLNIQMINFGEANNNGKITGGELNYMTGIATEATYDATDAAIIEFEVLHSYDKTNNPTGLGPDTLGWLMHYDNTKIEHLSSDVIYLDNLIGGKIDELEEAAYFVDSGTADDDFNTQRVLFGAWSSSSGPFQYSPPYTFVCSDGSTFETDNPFDPDTCSASSIVGSPTGGPAAAGDIPDRDFAMVRYSFRWISTSPTTTVTKISLNLNTVSDGKGYTSTADQITLDKPDFHYNRLTILGPPLTSTFAFATPENDATVGDIMGMVVKENATPTSIAITGGADADLFNIDFSADSGTATLSFVDAPNFENPQGGANDDSNNYEVVVTIMASSHDQGYDEVQTIIISVENVIEAPFLSGTPNLARVGSPYTFAPVVVNEEGQPLTYTDNTTSIGSSLPSGLSFNANTGIISGTPDTAGTAMVSIIAEFTDSLSGVKYAGTLTVTLTVEDKLDQTLVFANTDVFKTFGDANFTEAVSGTSSTATTVYSSSTSTVATVDGDGMVTIVGAGTTTISATNAGDYHYNPISTSYALTVSKADQLNFAFASDATRTIVFESGLQVPGIAVVGALGTGTTAYGSNDHDVAVVSSTNGDLVVQGAGVAIITATNTGDDNYNWASATYTITIEKANQTIAFATTGTIEIVADEGPFNNPASGEGGDGDITYALIYTPAGTETVATIDSATGEVTLVSAGVAIITAIKAESANYNSATAEYTLNIAQAFNLDIDGNASVSSGSDGLLVIKFMSFQDATTLDTIGIIGENSTRSDAEILAYLKDNMNLLDIDGNGSVSAGSDGLLIIKFLSFKDAATLDTTGIIGTGATRTSAEILTYLNDLLN